MITLTSSGSKTTVVESGSLTRTIEGVNADDTEIYVTLDSGETIELYFTDETTLSQNGEEVPFSTIEVGNSVEVTVEKTASDSTRLMLYCSTDERTSGYLANRAVAPNGCALPCRTAVGCGGFMDPLSLFCGREAEIPEKRRTPQPLHWSNHCLGGRYHDSYSD